MRIFSARYIHCIFLCFFLTSLLKAPATFGSTLEEVIVNVHKHSENLQDTPAAITAIGAEKLIAEGVTNARDLQSMLSGVRLQQENTSTEIYIRGVGSTLDFPQLDPPTSLHLNSIYIPREATSLGLYDIEQVEVIRGPQGTLYGRSSLGGLVNANFKRPAESFQTSILMEAGNYDMTHITAVQNIPVTETFAMRLAGDYHYRDGYNRSGADSADHYGARLSFLYNSSDTLSIYLWSSIAKLNGNPPNLVVKGVNPHSGAVDVDNYLQSDPWNDRLPAPWNGMLPFGQPQEEDYQTYHNHLSGAEITYQINDSLSLSYLPSYLDFEVSDNYWLAAFPANKTDKYRQLTNELRLNGKQLWGTWLLGLYHYELDSSGFFIFGGFDEIGLPGLFDLPVPVSIVDSNRLDGIAVFGQSVIELTPDMRLTLGARYGEDTRKGYGRFYDGMGLLPYDSDEDYQNLDFKVAMDYDLTEEMMVYAAVQTGFQPGTFNPYASTPDVSNRVNEAELTGYTLGVKSTLLSGRLLFNTELFYYDYEGLFAAAYNTVLNATQTFNADKTTIEGLQLDVLFSPSLQNQINLTVEYVNARYEDFILPDGTADYDGFQAQYSPEWTLVVGYQYEKPLETGSIRFGISSRFENSFYADFAHTPGGKQEAHNKTNLQLNYFAEKQKWSIGIWIKNIENVAVIAATAAGSNIPPNDQGATAFLESPRTYGVRFTFNY